jgi:sugar-specific transcriptional regulator TrmB
MKNINTTQARRDKHNLPKLHGNSQALCHCWLGVSGVGVEDVETLITLGLTGRQARVYLALLKTGDAKAKAIADLSLVNRQDIYLILDTLQQIGLIQRKITSPTTFKATPLDEALKTLLQQKTNELTLIRKKTSCLTQKFNQLTTSVVDPQETPCLGIVSEGDKGKKLGQSIENTFKSIETDTTWKRFKQVSVLFETQLESALKRGVIIRVITEKPENKALPNWTNNALNKKPDYFKLKALQTPPTAVATIFDNTQTVLAFNNSTDIKYGPHIWSNNPTTLALIKAYFTILWMELEEKT